MLSAEQRDPAGSDRPIELSGKDQLQVLGRAVDILRLLGTAPGGLEKTEIAHRLGMARTTTHRIIAALQHERLVEVRGPGTKYRLGAEISILGDAERSARVADIRPHLRALSRAIEETVDLVVLDGSQVLVIDQSVAQHRLVACGGIGGFLPSHCTAPGKALLARLSIAEVNRLLPEKLPPQTPSTIVSVARLLEELETVRARGYALDHEEHVIGICAVAVALDQKVLGPAAISVPIPAQRYAEKKAAAIAAALEAARAIGALFSAAAPDVSTPPR